MTPFQFWNALLSFTYAMGASVTSYGRTTLHNKDVGGVPGSAHRFFLAADVVYDVKPSQLDAEQQASKLGLRLIRESDHDHVQPLDWPKG